MENGRERGRETEIETGWEQRDAMKTTRVEKG